MRTIPPHILHTHTHLTNTFACTLKLTSPLTTEHSLHGVNEMNTRNTQQTVTSTLSGKVLPPHLLLLSPHRSSLLLGLGFSAELCLLLFFFCFSSSSRKKKPKTTQHMGAGMVKTSVVSLTYTLKEEK